MHELAALPLPFGQDTILSPPLSLPRVLDFQLKGEVKTRNGLGVRPRTHLVTSPGLPVASRPSPPPLHQAHDRATPLLKHRQQLPTVLRRAVEERALGTRD